jgi:hypothetical protein
VNRTLALGQLLVSFIPGADKEVGRALELEEAGAQGEAVEEALVVGEVPWLEEEGAGLQAADEPFVVRLPARKKPLQLERANAVDEMRRHKMTFFIEEPLLRNSLAPFSSRRGAVADPFGPPALPNHSRPFCRDNGKGRPFCNEIFVISRIVFLDEFVEYQELNDGAIKSYQKGGLPMIKRLKTIFGLVIAASVIEFSGVLLSGCKLNQGDPMQSSDRNIASIEVDEASMPNVVYIGEFNEAGIKLLVTYSDGASDTVSVTEDFIPEAYKHYLETPGQWNVTIYYRGTTTTIRLKIEYRYFTVDFYAMVTTNTVEKIGSQSVKKGDAATAPTNYVEKIAFEHTLYSFKAWDVDFSKISSDLKVTATYIEETIYWVSFFKADNSLIKKQYVKERGNAIAPSVSECTMSGYDFIGWDRTFTNVMKDLNIYGIYIKIENADKTTWTGDVNSGFYGGLYPQTVVEDDVTLAALSGITSVNSKGYIEYAGNQYYKAVAKVANLGLTSKSGKTAFATGSTYYFKVEPIRWHVLSSSGTSVMLLSEFDLHAMAFDDNSNNYKESGIRNWLTGDFYNQAFNENDKNKILTTTVDNGLTSTTDTSNPYTCEDTQDKVYLLSRKELSLVTWSYSYAAVATDYARVTNACVSSGQSGWWLRSPRPASAMASWCIGYAGDVYSGNICTVNDTCVRPVLNLSLQ